MNEVMKHIGAPVLLLILVLVQVTPALARSDDLIQHEIEVQIAESAKLRGASIEVQVVQRFVVLTGQVRIYEQKLISERIAWTTLGVFEVDNEIRVVPMSPLSDAAIEQKVKEIVKADEQLRAAEVTINVTNGEVFLRGSFLGFRDPLRLKHKVAEIEGVIDIKISAAFFARLSGS